MSEDHPPPSPRISPYVFPFLLAGMGLWCFYDGWIGSDPEMQEYILFNRVGSIVLLLWAVADFFRTRKLEKQDQASESSDQAGS